MKKANAKEQFIELRAEGMSYTDIACKLNVSKPTLIKWSQELQLEISNARSIYFDALFRKYAVAKEKRINAFGQRLEKVMAELNKRDLSKIPTEKLFKIVMDLSDRLKAEEVPLLLSKKVSWDEHMSLDDSTKQWEM